MSRSQKTLSFQVRFLLSLVFTLRVFGESTAESELSSREVLNLLESVALLPEWDTEYDGDSVSILLSYDKDPDYKLLESIQQQEQILEASVKPSPIVEKVVDLTEYFGHREALFIRDPKYLLTSAERIEIQDLLSSYAGEFGYDFHLNLLTKLEIEALALLSEERHKQILAGDPKGISIYYFYDDPGQTVVYFNELSAQGIPKAVRDQVHKASQKHLQYSGDRYRTLYRYLLDVTLEISNYLQTQQERVSDVAIASLETPNQTQEKQPLPPRQAFISIQIGWRMIATISAVGLVLLLLFRVLLMYRERKQYVFPVSNIDDHLGFPRGGSCSGIVFFADSSPSVDEQEKTLYS